MQRPQRTPTVNTNDEQLLAEAAENALASRSPTQSPRRIPFAAPKVGASPKDALGPRRGSLKVYADLKAFQDLHQAPLLDRQTSTSESVLRNFLSAHSVSELSTPDKVVEIDTSMSPQQGFQLLLDNSILGAPVWDNDKKEYIGFLDMRDLVSQVISANKDRFESNCKKAESLHQLLLKNLTHESNVLKPKKICNISYWAARNKFVPVSDSANILSAALVMCGEAHRVPVVDASGRCKTIISQSSIIKFLAQHIGELTLNDGLAENLAELGLGMKQVATVPSSLTAYECFKYMDDCQFSGVGVVESGSGVLIGNTSARDIKNFMSDNGPSALHYPILDYLSKIRQEVPGDERHPICRVLPTTPVSKVIRMLGATGYHRLFVTDQVGRPVGVVSLTDVMRLACGKPAKARRISAGDQEHQQEHELAAAVAAVMPA